MIGNAPSCARESSPTSRPTLRRVTRSSGAADLYVFFIEQSLGLLNPGGLYGNIVSSSFMRASSESGCDALRGRAAVLELIDVGGQAVFDDAEDTYVCIPILSRAPQPERIAACRAYLAFDSLYGYVEEHGYTIPQSQVAPEAWSVRSEAERAVLAGESGQAAIGQVCSRKMLYGIRPV